MFTNYFRNGLHLLLNAEGDNASILDFPRIFSDDTYRAKLLGKCKNSDVRLFWRGIVDGAQYEAKLSNHAPYIVCKMSPITGNAHLKRILGANRSTLDFGKVIEEQKICLINLAQPYLAKEASRFLGGMITARLVASAKVTQAVRSRRAAQARQRLHGRVPDLHQRRARRRPGRGEEIWPEPGAGQPEPEPAAGRPVPGRGCRGGDVQRGQRDRLPGRHRRRRAPGPALRAGAGGREPRKAAELPCRRHHRPRLSRLGSGDIRDSARAEAAAAKRTGQTSRGGRRACGRPRAHRSAYWRAQCRSACRRCESIMGPLGQTRRQGGF